MSILLKTIFGMVFEKLYRNTLVTLARIRMGFFSPNRRTHGPRTATKFSCVSSHVRLCPVSHSVLKSSYDQPQIRLLYTQNSLTQRSHFTVVLVASSKCASTYILPRVMSIGVIICSIQADHLWYSRAPATFLTNSSSAWTNTSGIDETYRETTRHIM